MIPLVIFKNDPQLFDIQGDLGNAIFDSCIKCPANEISLISLHRYTIQKFEIGRILHRYFILKSFKLSTSLLDPFVPPVKKRILNIPASLKRPMVFANRWWVLMSRRASHAEKEVTQSSPMIEKVIQCNLDAQSNDEAGDDWEDPALQDWSGAHRPVGWICTDNA